MYAYEIFDELKKCTDGLTREKIINVARNNANICYNYFLSLGASKDESYRACMMAFAMIACNDGKIGNDEHQLFRAIFGDFSYDNFFTIMSTYNKQEYRNQIAKIFTSIKNVDVVKSFLVYCMAVSRIDGDIHDNEETLITSLCGIFRDKFC